MGEHFRAGVGSKRDEIVRRVDGNFEARHISGRFAVRETGVRPVHGKADVQELGANDDALYAYASLGRYG